MDILKNNLHLFLYDHCLTPNIYVNKDTFISKKLKHLYPTPVTRCSSVARAFAHGAMRCRIDPSWLILWAISHSSRCNKGCCMCYPVCGMMHIKEPLLVIRKSSPCAGSGFPLSLSDWSFTICLMPYKYNVLSVSLNKTFHSFQLQS